MDNIWQLQEAKGKFSEIVDHALAQGAQIITRRGRKVVVVLSYVDYERLTRRGNSPAEFLLASPLAGSELPIER